MLRYPLSILRFLGAFLLLLLCYLGGILLYPIVYWTHNWKISKKAPLWWWFDDEDGLYGAEYWRKAKNITKNNFWVSYRWSGLRNPMWNAHTKLVPPSGPEKKIWAFGHIEHQGYKVDLNNSAVIHYVNANGTWNGNAGKYASQYYSYLGFAFYLFKKDEQIHWRISAAGKVVGPFWIEFQLGTFHRYIVKLKFKWIKNVFEDSLSHIDSPKETINNFFLNEIPEKELYPKQVSKILKN